LEGGAEIEIRSVSESVRRVNERLGLLKEKTEKLSLNVFEVIDFRMLSGLVGEMLVSEISNTHNGLQKNPNIDGYPDLLNASRTEFLRDIEVWEKTDTEKFIRFPHGGIEVKNTFGTKKAKAMLAPGDPRIGKINKKLDWKAHHRRTNHLLGLYSDFVDGYPQIVGVMYSDQLTEEDWKAKQNPRPGSTMTSFTVIDRTGWDKLRTGIRLCRNEPRYLSFFGVE
jgi:hypothetical protein